MTANLTRRSSNIPLTMFGERRQNERREVVGPGHPREPAGRKQ
jgi:hypothetical protein